MPNDGVEDTPAVEKSHWDKDTKNCYDEYTDWENFMNYTDHYRHFTKGRWILWSNTCMNQLVALYGRNLI